MPSTTVYIYVCCASETHYRCKFEDRKASEKGVCWEVAETSPPRRRTHKKVGRQRSEIACFRPPIAPRSIMWRSLSACSLARGPYRPAAGAQDNRRYPHTPILAAPRDAFPHCKKSLRWGDFIDEHLTIATQAFTLINGCHFSIRGPCPCHKSPT